MAERVMMIALSPTMEEGTIVQWTKNVGDTVASGDVICEVETDKATMDYESTQEGVLLQIAVPAGKTAKVGDVIAVLGAAGEEVVSAAPTVRADTQAASAPAASSANGGPATDETGATLGTPGAVGAKASPLARKLAQQQGVDLMAVAGSGPGGRVVKRDIQAASTATVRASTAPAMAAAGARPAAGAGVSQPAAAGADVDIPVTGKRAVIARRLSESMFSAPHYYLTNSINMGAVMGARALLNKARPDKVGFNAFIVKFVAEALRRHPDINAGWMGDHIRRFGSIDIGLAVDVGNGLITPIVRNCANKGVLAIDAEIKQLIEKAGAGSLKPEEYSGATFTISNLGSFGVEEFTAIINPPGSAILAVGETIKTPVFADDGSVVAANIMKVTLSCDHRVIDGALGGRFLAEIKALMQEPVRILF